MKYYSGAGILPVIIYNNKPYYIVFNISKKFITDAGGKKEYTDDILETACRELFEESAGLIRINKNILHENSIYFDIKHKDKYYRSYIIIINKIDTKYYDKNLKKINKFNYNPFAETHGIELIDFNSIYKSNILIDNLTNKVFILTPRLNTIIKKILKKYNNFNKLYLDLIKNIKIIRLQKKKINVKTYEYYTNTPIEIKSIIIYTSVT